MSRSIEEQVEDLDKKDLGSYGLKYFTKTEYFDQNCK